MARLMIALSVLFFAIASQAFDIEVEIVFPGTSQKSGIVLGFDKNNEHILYPVHTYGTKINHIGFFKRNNTDLSAYFFENIKSMEKDLVLPGETSTGFQHDYKILIDGKPLKQSSKYFTEILKKTARLEVSPSWKPVRAQKYWLHKEKGLLTVETFHNGKSISRITKPAMQLCIPNRADGFVTCTSAFGTISVPLLTK